MVRSKYNTACDMKCLLLMSVIIAETATSLLKNPIQGYKEENRYFPFTGDDGITMLVDTQEPLDTNYLEEYIRNPNNNGYWLFTRVNPDTEHILLLDNIDSVTSSNYDSWKVTVFIAHGWKGDGRHYMNKILTSAFLENDDVNVIVLDWGQLAGRNYVTAKGGTAAVGIVLGQFVNWLVDTGFASYDRIHLVGFSLGGHLVGNAGRQTGSAVARITALDPAAPLWGRDENRLVHTDARYVEVIHTDTRMLGWADPCGDADFYPNGGSGMPGCIVNRCSHNRAFEYMASSVEHNHFLANECESVNDAMRDRCNGTLNFMGNSDLKKSRHGIFRVNTGRNYPY